LGFDVRSGTTLLSKTDRRGFGPQSQRNGGHPLVRRRRNPHNRRESIIELTQHGRDIMRWVDDHFVEVTLSAFHPFSIKELDIARDMARRFLQDIH
jgi:DNA-binding MarR family transcriptional regulator